MKQTKESRLFELKVLETIAFAETTNKRSRELLARSRKLLAQSRTILKGKKFVPEDSFMREAHKTYLAAMREK